MKKIYQRFKQIINYSLTIVEDLILKTLNNRSTSKKLINYFYADDGHNLDRKKSFLGYGMIHYSLIRNLRPKRILCIGSRYGFIPAICSLACKDSNYGKVDFIDAAFEQSHPKSWTGVGFWKKVNPEQHFSVMGLNKWIKTYLMLANDFAKKYPKYHYGYIYIDGDHSYKGVKKDFKTFWPRLEKGGFMAFHDAVYRGKEGKEEYGVWRFWKEIKNKNKIIFDFPKNSGLGIIQKI